MYQWGKKEKTIHVIAFHKIKDIVKASQFLASHAGSQIHWTDTIPNMDYAWDTTELNNIHPSAVNS